MVVRALVAVLLMHHIEGVCKPWSAVTRIIAGFVASRASRGLDERQAAIERAEAGRTAAIERARQAAPSVRPLRPVAEPNRTALPPSTPAASWHEQARQAMREEGRP
jgi:hypothetical protein